MSPDALLVALLRAWDRAVAVAGAEDLPREYVNVLLPVMPESAADVLRALRDAPLHQECFLLMDQATLPGRHARDLFLERVGATALPVSSAEIIAQAATAVDPAERGPFRERALAAIAAETVPGERRGALADTAERDALVAAMFGASRHHAPHRDLLDRMAPLLESVCGERDATWSARVAAFFEAQEWDVGSFLDAVAAFAPVLRRLGGAELPRTLAARLPTPIAPTALERPWALAAQGAFDA